MPLRLLPGAAAGATVLALSACGPTAASTTSPTASPSPDCAVAHFPFPRPAVQLGAADNGKRAIVAPGQLVAVALLGNSSTHWEPIAVSGQGLTRLVNPAQAATIGTQLAELCAVAKGTSRLSSGNEHSTWSAVVEVQ